MTRGWRRIIGLLVGGFMLLPTTGQTQRRPDFSGTWELVEALASGRGRDGAATEGPRRTTSTTISGAAFNCGRGCTIAHTGDTLTVANARLAGSERAVPSVTFRLDGRETNVVDALGAPRELPVTATWQGDKLDIDTGSGGVVWKQVLSLEKDHLVVLSSHQGYGTETTFRYRKQ